MRRLRMRLLFWGGDLLCDLGSWLEEVGYRLWNRGYSESDDETN
jgi:hypothetical protein